MEDRRRDGRFVIEGDPEDALRSLMDTGALPEFTVALSEAEGGGDFPEGPVAPGEPTPVLRVFEWRGNAPDEQGALAQAQDAWAKHYGDRPGNARAVIKRV